VKSIIIFYSKLAVCIKDSFYFLADCQLLCTAQRVKKGVFYMNYYYLAIIVAIVALVLAAIFASGNAKIQIESDRLKELSGYIRTGAMAFLTREYKIVAIYAVVMFIVLLVVPGMGIKVALCFLVGALLSTLAGFIGMRSATSCNAQTAQAAKESERKALNIAFTGGSVMGLCVVGLGLLGVAVLYVILGDINVMTGFSLGASSIALFSRVGGGIYTKAADVGADLVGKVEAGIPEDDPRNPAVIADNVGDNVGDVAGMGADLFESYVGSIISAMMLGILALGQDGAAFAMAIAAFGLISSIIGILIVRVVKNMPAQRTLMLGTYVAMVLLVISSAIASIKMLHSWNYFIAILTGVIVGTIIGSVTERYTSDKFKHVQEIVEQSSTGSATNILAGLSVGMKSTGIPILLIAIAVVISSTVAGLFGVALAAVGMLATVGAVIAVDAYGPIADNAGGLAEMSGMPHEVREVTDKLDSIGNTTAAIGKGFSIGSAALTALAMFSSYASTVGLDSVNVLDPKVVAGIFIGGMLAFLFSAMAIEAVSKSAGSMIHEVRRQFREIPGIMEGTGKPDYAKCVDISTAAALKEMVLPGVMTIASPIVAGIILGKEGLAGLLVGATVVGVLCAIFMSNSGGAWDNAKKSIEASETEGKGSARHAAAVVGDTVGDPLKDTAGPSLNILIKLMSIVALVFAPLFM
jgi:K(+)-stimulated pyrophosphate-energized sodium pump